MADIVPINFFTTTLRAPVLTTDTQIQLASGSTTPLSVIGTGDFVYLTVSDGTTVEVMKYTSTGSITADTLIVARAQDNTTAKAFPTGACVAIGWNVAQIEAVITQFITGSPSIPANTQTITGATNVPTDAPGDNVIYTINVTTGQSWYWTGASWVPLSSNNIQIVAGVPSDPPNGGVIWTFNSTAATLYFWDGVAWELISAEPGYLEIFDRQYLDTVTGVTLAAGADYVFSDMITDETLSVTPYYYKSNPLVVGIIEPTATNELEFTQECLVQITATITGEIVDPTKNLRVRLVLFHAGSLAVFTSEAFYLADGGGDVVGISVTTGPLHIEADDQWDSNLVILDDGADYSDLLLHQYTMNASVIARIDD